MLAIFLYTWFSPAELKNNVNKIEQKKELEALLFVYMFFKSILPAESLRTVWVIDLCYSVVSYLVSI